MKFTPGVLFGVTSLIAWSLLVAGLTIGHTYVMYWDEKDYLAFGQHIGFLQYSTDSYVGNWAYNSSQYKGYSQAINENIISVYTPAPYYRTTPAPPGETPSPTQRQTPTPPIEREFSYETFGLPDDFFVGKLPFATYNEDEQKGSFDACKDDGGLAKTSRAVAGTGIVAAIALPLVALIVLIGQRKVSSLVRGLIVAVPTVLCFACMITAFVAHSSGTCDRNRERTSFENYSHYPPFNGEALQDFPNSRMLAGPPLLLLSFVFHVIALVIAVTDKPDIYFSTTATSPSKTLIVTGMCFVAFALGAAGAATGHSKFTFTDNSNNTYDVAVRDNGYYPCKFYRAYHTAEHNMANEDHWCSLLHYSKTSKWNPHGDFKWPLYRQFCRPYVQASQGALAGVILGTITSVVALILFFIGAFGAGEVRFFGTVLTTTAGVTMLITGCLSMSLHFHDFCKDSAAMSDNNNAELLAGPFLYLLSGIFLLIVTVLDRKLPDGMSFPSIGTTVFARSVPKGIIGTILGILIFAFTAASLAVGHSEVPAVASRTQPNVTTTLGLAEMNPCPCYPSSSSSSSSTTSTSYTQRGMVYGATVCGPVDVVPSSPTPAPHTPQPTPSPPGATPQGPVYNLPYPSRQQCSINPRQLSYILGSACYKFQAYSHTALALGILSTFPAMAAAIISFISAVVKVDELTFVSGLIFAVTAFLQTVTTIIYFALHYVDLGCDGLNKPLSDMPNAQALSGPPLMLVATVLSLIGALVMLKMPSSWSFPTATHGSIPGCVFSSIALLAIFSVSVSGMALPYAKIERGPQYDVNMYLKGLTYCYSDLCQARTFKTEFYKEFFGADVCDSFVATSKAAIATWSFSIVLVIACFITNIISVAAQSDEVAGVMRTTMALSSALLLVAGSLALRLQYGEVCDGWEASHWSDFQGAQLTAGPVLLMVAGALLAILWVLQVIDIGAAATKVFKKIMKFFLFVSADKKSVSTVIKLFVAALLAVGLTGISLVSNELVFMQQNACCAPISCRNISGYAALEADDQTPLGRSKNRVCYLSNKQRHALGCDPWFPRNPEFCTVPSSIIYGCHYRPVNFDVGAALAFFVAAALLIILCGVVPTFMVQADTSSSAPFIFYNVAGGLLIIGSIIVIGLAGGGMGRLTGKDYDNGVGGSGAPVTYQAATSTYNTRVGSVSTTMSCTTAAAASGSSVSSSLWSKQKFSFDGAVDVGSGLGSTPNNPATPGYIARSMVVLQRWRSETKFIYVGFLMSLVFGLATFVFALLLLLNGIRNV